MAIKGRSQTPATSAEMDPGVWSRLPEDLLERVLSFLPLKSFLNLTSTCKHFKSLVFSPSFISKHSSPSSPSSPFSSFLLLSHPQLYREYPLYDTILNSWRELSLSLSLVLSFAPSITLMSASNGLLCFSLPNSSSFLVCNLLSRSSRIVEFPAYPFTFELLTLVSGPNGYKIFMLSSPGSSITAFLYDSGCHSWRQFDCFNLNLSGGFHQEGVCYNGCLYFTTPEPFSIVCFDLESGKWDRWMVELPGELTFVRLVSDGNGKLFMFGGIGRNGISRSMKLWELNGEGESWVEVESVPEMMCRKFLSVCYHNYEQVYCFWQQGMVYLCCYTWPEILYYKVSRRTWHWLPKCPFLPDKCSCGFRWFSFVPDLYACV